MQNFFYTLKLCYELGLTRTINIVENLQSGIFDKSNSYLKDGFLKLNNLVFRRLSSWVYLSGQYYAMHDVSKEAIKFNDYINMKITNYLSENLTNIIPNEDSAIYSFGLFWGKISNSFPETGIIHLFPLLSIVI